MTRERLHNRGICVVVPTYNNAGTIADVVGRCKTQCQDVIVVNDGSTDRTAQILRDIDGITIVDLPKNSGKGTALKAGFRKALEAGFTYAITLDADGQHYPEDIPLLLQANIAHPDAIIIGERKDLDSKERSGGSKFANAFSNFWFCVQTGRRLRDTQTGYRLYPLHKLYGLSLLTSRYEAELELLVFSAWHGVKLVQQPINVYYPPKEQRVSHFRPAYDFTRISILNTCLCFLALLYGLPMALLRWFMILFRSLYALSFFVMCTTLFLIPLTKIYPLLQHNAEKRTWGLHLILYYIGRLVINWHGIPGVRYEKHNANVNVNVNNENETLRYENFAKPAMVICNHQSPLDLMAMLEISPRMAILTKDWVYRNPLFGKVLQQGEYYPVSMGMDDLLPKLQSLIDRGYSIVIYPEGTRSADGRIQRFHKGAFEIARALNLDIVPILEYAPGRVLPKGGKYLRKGIIHMDIGRRVPPEEYLQYGETREIASHFRQYYTQRYIEVSDHIDRTTHHFPFFVSLKPINV